MTQADFNRQFKKAYPQFKVMTLTDRRLYYNDYMQVYYNAGLITLQQRQNWGILLSLQVARVKLIVQLTKRLFIKTHLTTIKD